MTVVLDLPRIQAAVTLPAAVAAVEAGFLDLARGKVQLPPATGLELPGGEIHLKAAHLGQRHPVVVKVATGFPGNAVRGLATGDGMMLAIDPDTGQITTVLADRGWLTDVRTAAATAVAVRHLADAPVPRLAVLGTGVQADLTLRTLHAVGLLGAEVALWGRDRGRAAGLARRLDLGETTVTVSPTAEAAARGSGAVVTVTAARAPVLRGRWLEPDALVVAVGADSPGKRECDADVLRRADHVVTDHREQALRLGELQHAPPGAVPPSADLGDLLLAGSGSPSAGLTVCDLTGLGVHDAAVAAIVLNSG